MGKKITAQEKFNRFKEKVNSSFFNMFWGLYEEMKDIEKQLLQEEKTRFTDKANSEVKG